MSPARGELARDLLDLVVAAAGLAVVVEHAEPVLLVAVVDRVPVPVLDHARAAGDERPRRLAPLPVERGEVPVREPDRERVGLGDQERLSERGVGEIGLEVDRPRARMGRPAELRRVRRRLGHRQRVLHRVVRVDRGDVEARAVELARVERGAAERHARGHELVRAGDLAHDRRLRGDEVGRELRLVAAPREVVRRDRVAVRRPQLVPAGDPVRPVDEAPLAVERAPRRRTWRAASRRSPRRRRGCGRAPCPARCRPGSRSPPDAARSGRRPRA